MKHALIALSVLFGLDSAASAGPQLQSATRRARLAFSGTEAIVALRDNPTSRALWASLPMTLTFSDYAGTEKIASLPRKLSTDGAPAGSDPSVGDFTYYAPWGNLAIFYKDFRYSSGLVLLGRVESGMEKLAALEGDATVTIQRIE